MNKALTAIALAFIACTVTLLAAEGIYSLVQWGNADGSVAYKAYRLIVDGRPQAVDDEALPGHLRMATRSQIEALLPDMIEARAGMGNTPYQELKREEAAVNARTQEGCLVMKPNLRKTITHLRTNEYNPFDLPNLFFDESAVLSDNIRALVSEYGLRKLTLSTNGSGERTTIPSIKSRSKVLIAGGSVAAGMMMSDEETLSSQLQKLDSARQYVNLGVGGAEASDIICNLEAAARRYHGEIEELIYEYSENDFNRDLPYGQPDQVLSWIKDFVRREEIGKVTVIQSLYIYNIIPHLTRFRGYRGWTHAQYSAEARRLADEVKAAGFRFVSFAEMALSEARERKTDFAVFALFVDQGHLSPYGTARLVEKLRAQGNSASLFSR